MTYHTEVIDGKTRRLPGNEINRFWSKIIYNNGCWDFTSNPDKDGYGRFKTLENGAWVNRRAHRLMFSKLHGEIPEGIQILHKCDRPSCVNPSHLFAGTPKQNTHDMMDKGRKVVLKGEDTGHAKLTKENVIEIKSRIAKGEVLNDIGRDFGVTGGAIGCIKNGQSWRHVS